MEKIKGIALGFLVITLGINAGTTLADSMDSQSKDLRYSGENHLTHLRQLTFGGENAEAYFLLMVVS